MIDIKVLASGSSGNCIYVNDGSSPLLLECGVRFKEIQRGLNFQVSSLAGCLVSHEHKDHCKSVKELMKAGIDCYMLKATADALGATGHRVKIVEPLKQFKIGSSWTILPFPLVHDVENVGYLMASSTGDKLVYLTDTVYCKFKFVGLTHILVEINNSLEILRDNVRMGVIPLEMKNRIIKTHFSLENVKEFLRASDLSRVEEIHIIHVSETNGDKELFKNEIEKITGKMVICK